MKRIFKTTFVRQKVIVSILFTVLILGACSAKTDKNDTKDTTEVGLPTASTEAQWTDATDESTTEAITTGEAKPTEESTEETVTPTKTDEADGSYVVVAGEKVAVPEWFVGILLNAQDLGREYPGVRYDKAERVMYVPDEEMNDADGYVKRYEVLSEIEGEAEALGVSAETFIWQANGKKLQISLDGEGVQEIYTDDAASYVMIDGVGYQLYGENMWLYECFGMPTQVTQTEEKQRTLLVVDIDRLDDFVELVLCVDNRKYVVMRYDGVGLYQVAAFATITDSMTDMFDGAGNIYITEQQSNLIQTQPIVYRLALVEDTLMRAEATYVDLWQMPDDERYAYDGLFNLKNMVSLTLYEEADASAPTMALQPQEINLLQWDMGDWILIEGRADGVTGWFCTSAFLQENGVMEEAFSGRVLYD